MNIVAYGGGTDSTAMLIECVKRDIKIDLILFADTGSENPHTYKFYEVFNKWCIDNGLPEIIKVKGTQPQMVKDGSLEAECLRLKVLPSRTYGYGSCSMKWKREPQDKYVRQLPKAKKVWDRGDKLVKFIGYDSNEQKRANKILGIEDNQYTYRFPLIEWGITREQCIDIIKDVGLCPPGKSACWFCPSSKQHEIRSLKMQYPELAERAIAMEENANLTSIKGLGRSFSWKNLLATDDMFEEEENKIDLPCGCYDG